MDWSFLNIFKKADFNTLMFSIAVTGWILLCIYPEFIYIRIAAILCSIYCVSRFVVFLFKSNQEKKIIKANRLYDEKQEKKLLSSDPFCLLKKEEKELLLYFRVLSDAEKHKIIDEMKEQEKENMKKQKATLKLSDGREIEVEISEKE